MEYSKKMLKGYRIPRPPPLNGASLFGDLLKRKKILEALFPWKKRGKS